MSHFASNLFKLDDVKQARIELNLNKKKAICKNLYIYTEAVALDIFLVSAPHLIITPFVNLKDEFYTLHASIKSSDQPIWGNSTIMNLEESNPNLDDCFFLLRNSGSYQKLCVIWTTYCHCALDSSTGLFLLSFSLLRICL